jgi:hypothetical protein
MVESRMSARPVCLAFCVVLISGCSSTQSAERKIEAYDVLFHRLGMSADAGLYKKSEPHGAWNHVATVYGKGENLDFCQAIVAALAAPAVQHDTYECRLLNE